MFDVTVCVGTGYHVRVIMFHAICARTDAQLEYKNGGAAAAARARCASGSRWDLDLCVCECFTIVGCVCGGTPHRCLSPALALRAL